MAGPLAQEVTDVLGSPSATTTISGEQLPAPDPKFGRGKIIGHENPGPDLKLTINFDALTQIAEYDEYRAGMLMNQRPDGTFTNW